MKNALISAPISAARAPLSRNGAGTRNEAAKAEIKIAYIGGGSREWATKLLGDLALSSKVSGAVHLYDIDFEAAKHNAKLGERIFSHADAKTRFKTIAVRTLAEALRGADFVVISIEPGPITLRHSDLEIPASYGILQTVGDTTGPGGLLRAMRTAPIYERFVAAIMEHCPEAWVINYTNPMSLCVATLFSLAPEIKALGCCHEVFGTQKMVAEKVALWFGVPLPERTEIELDIAGVNHFTWATQVRWRGHDLMPRLRQLAENPRTFADRTAEARRFKREQSWFHSRSLVALDLLRRFGALGAAGDRHLAEFVPWYLASEKELHRWGVVATPYSWRVARTGGPRPSLEAVGNAPLAPSGEEGVQQIEALLGLRSLTTNINLPNRGQVAELPLGSVVETYAEFGRDAIRPVVSSPLPSGAAELVRRVASQQGLILRAIGEKNLDLAFQALLSDALVRIPTDRAYAMFQEMVSETRAHLPGWR